MGNPVVNHVRQLFGSVGWMVGSSTDVKRRIVRFAVWPKLSGVEVKGYVLKICSK